MRGLRLERLNLVQSWGVSQEAELDRINLGWLWLFWRHRRSGLDTIIYSSPPSSSYSFCCLRLPTLS